MELLPQALSISQCESCKKLEAQLQEKLKEIDVLRENLKTLKSKIIDSSKLLSIYTDTKSENEVLKEQNKKLRDDFVLYKNENPIDVQIAQYKEMKSQFDQLTNRCNMLQYTNEQLAASIENNQKTKDENEKLKTTVKEKEKQIQALKDAAAKKNGLMQEYYERGGLDRIKSLEAEVEILRVRNNTLSRALDDAKGRAADSALLLFPTSDSAERPPAASSIDGLIEAKVRLLIKQAIPTIAKTVAEFNISGNMPRATSHDFMADDIGIIQQQPSLSSQPQSIFLDIPQEDNNINEKEAVAKIKDTEQPETKVDSNKEEIKVSSGLRIKKKKTPTKVTKGKKRNSSAVQKDETRKNEDSEEMEIVEDIGKALTMYEAQKRTEKITATKKLKRKKNEYNDWIVPKNNAEDKLQDKNAKKRDLLDDDALGTRKAVRKNSRLTLGEIENIIADIMLVISVFTHSLLDGNML